MRATLDERPTEAEIILLIAPLFQAFPAFSDDTTGDQKMDLYVIALEGRTRKAINEAVKDFIRGNVEKHDGRFLPPPAQVAKQTLKRETEIIDLLHAKKLREQRAANPKPKPEARHSKRSTFGPIDIAINRSFPDQAFLRELPVGSRIQASPLQITLSDGEIVTPDEWTKRKAKQ